MKHLDKHQILTDYQHGFRASRSCESQLLIIINDIAKSMNAGEQMDTILLDFSKAFDKVPYQRLLLKLRHYGIRGNLLDWIEDFLSERTWCNAYCAHLKYYSHLCGVMLITNIIAVCVV